MPMTETDRRSYLLGLQIAGDFGASIAVPVVVLVVAGKWAQNKWGFAPWGVALGFALAVIISALIVNRRAKFYAAEYRALKK